MSEQQPKRTSQIIKAEHTNIAFRAGNLQHLIFKQKNDLGMLNETMRDLELEYVQVAQQEADLAEALAAEKAKAAQAEAKTEPKAEKTIETKEGNA